MDATPVLFSIVIPTYNRRDIVLSTVMSVAATRRPWPCELIVVVDGSQDGTAEALAGLDLPLPLTILQQQNQGAAAARNAGAAAARGEHLFFLDDDMTVDPDLLVEHERTLTSGADAVVGHIQLDPRSPRNLLTRGIERWADERRARLDRSGGRLGVGDFLSGQLSVRRQWFARLGGFDAGLTADGTFGGEDTDLVYRLLQAGARVRANMSAVSHQHYVVSPEQNIRQWTQAGRADTMLARKHPGLGSILTASHRGNTVAGRLVRTLAALPEGPTRAAGDLVVRRVGRGRMDPPTEYLYARFRDTVYWRAVREHGGLAGPAYAGPRILAYHEIEDLGNTGDGQYGVPPELFAEQIAALLEAGHRFIDAGDLLDYLDGRPLPPRSVLLTFDDAYESVLTHAAPVLDRLGIRGLICVVSDQIGGYNAWVADHGEPRRRLLSAAELATLRAAGWEIASHSRRHAHLTTLGAGELTADVRRSSDVLAAAGLGRPRLFVYPYGEHDARVRACVRRAGFSAALAVTADHACPGPDSRYALPRIEVKRDTTPAALLRLLAEPARTRPAARARRELHGLATALGVPAALRRLRGTGSTSPR